MTSLFKIGTYKLQNEGNKNEKCIQILRAHITSVFNC
jgi:hypothetical protein